MSFKLERLVQCAKCPWKKDTNPHDIPHGYDVDLHKSLQRTIAVPGDLSQVNNKILPIMACHHSNNGQEYHCIGWLYNQLGAGNNIPLRLNMMDCENIGQIKVIGVQHESFEDTLPK